MSRTDTPIDAPIERCGANWHLHLRGDLPGGLDALLHEECVFFSPIVFTPQRGREITKLYLTAAGATLGGDAATVQEAGGTESGRGFRYV